MNTLKTAQKATIKLVITQSIRVRIKILMHNITEKVITKRLIHLNDVDCMAKFCVNHVTKNGFIGAYWALPL